MGRSIFRIQKEFSEIENLRSRSVKQWRYSEVNRLKMQTSNLNDNYICDVSHEISGDIPMYSIM